MDELLLLEENGESFISHKGDLVVKQDLPCKGVLVLVNGRACIKVEKQEQKSIVQFLKPGDTFYTHEAFLGLANKSSCSCMETSLIYFISVDTLKENSAKNPKFLINVLNMASKESELFEQRATKLVALPVKFRFIDSLLTLIKKFGEEKSDHLFIPIKRDEIGSYINASKASLSRVVNELENSKIIQTSRKGIKVFNQKALLEI